MSQSFLRLLDCLPIALSAELSRLGGSYFDFRSSLEEIRLRAGRASSIVFRGKNILLATALTESELCETLCRLCGGSVYAFADSLREGFVTFDGGYRVGVAGRAVSSKDTLVDVGSVSSLCVRIPHAVEGAGRAVVEAFERSCGGGVLVYSPPGCGKTTALRSAALVLSSGESPLRTVVVDSRGELGGDWFGQDCLVDVLTAYPKAEGISIATRTLSPQLIVCDEIGGRGEARALLEVQRSGVPVIASAHGSSLDDILSRPSLASLVRGGMFASFVGIKKRGDRIYEYEETGIGEAEALLCAQKTAVEVVV